MPFPLNKNLFAKIALLARVGSDWGNRLALLLIFAAILSGFSTYAALTEAPPFGSDPETVIWLLNLDMVILLVLGILIARRIANLWSGRRRGLAGSRLHVRLVFVFGLLAATPAILMTVFAAFFLHFGVQSWFSERVSTAVNRSQAVAEAYLREHQQVIRVDMMGMANDLNRQAEILTENLEAFAKVMRTQSLLRNFSEVIVFDRAGQVLAHAGVEISPAFAELRSVDLAEADAGEIVLMTSEDDDRVRALVRLENFADAYLFVGRMVDPTVLSYLADTRQAVAAYEALEGQYSNLQVKITLIFVVVALLLLLAATWFGLIFARQLVLPIGELITAAERVRGGDLTARVREFRRGDEFTLLARTFNRMTSQLQEQRDELVAANRQIDQRRHFIETVLAGVSAGIVGVDEKGVVRLVNNSACELFQTESDALSGQLITAIIPDLAPLLEQAHQKPGKITQFELPYVCQDGTKRVLLVRMAIEMLGEEDKGAVLTFDDITELQSAQRKAAWADVARRIAHEIKNPLTPIQLSAERLKRKYLSQIKDDQDIFAQCTDTIIHHVGDIGRMVNEFSAFARMPEPVIKRDDLGRSIRDMLTLEQQAHPDISFGLTGLNEGDEAVFAAFDTRQIRQAMTNIIQNAIDSIHARQEQDSVAGRIDILMSCHGQDIFVAVTDNGLGLPGEENVDNLTEPYVTHKAKGTGLGLAIVKKIMDDHHGRLVLGVPGWLKDQKDWVNLGGATVILVLPAEGEDMLEIQAA
ncbi:MAG: PAS domain-containing sensor histidine kinase [Rhodospirillales bacterium]|nr:PAS domain-containing sensor histidine kinase [Rhodospirillales bacterium]